MLPPAIGYMESGVARWLADAVSGGRGCCKGRGICNRSVMLTSATDTRESSPAPRSAIAVIGMAGRFPGARDVGAFWTNVRDGVESIHAFTDAELLAAGESPGRLRDPSYVKACGRLDDIDKFAATFFGLSPRDAAVFDPQHRLFLECAWEAFEHAGYVAEKYAGPVGVFASSGASEYMMYNLVRNRRIMDSVGAWLVRHTGNDPSFLATRVSYELNLRGPSMNVQTACSSSLLAVHVACQSLLNYECDMALAGGATVYPEQNRGYSYREGEILSPDGHCRAFDAGAAGTVMASAVGCVVLKRLDDALRDGDCVLAVVLGSAINNDGSEKVGYLAPSVAGQARVVGEALAVAGVNAEDVSYVEAHGTGTLIGDPIEVAALTEAFRATTDKTRFCAIGSLKTNIGHAGEAAGVCGFIKTVLALAHRQIPPSLHYRSPNPQIDFAGSPFFVNDSLRDWTVPSGKRRIAGVTALGAGGTNVHVLVEEAAPRAAQAADAGPQMLVLSAKTPSALDQASQNLAAHLRAHPDVSIADVAYTLLTGRKGFGFRRAVVAKSAEDAADALERGATKRAMTNHCEGDAPEVVFMFPGGGAQYGGMGAELYAREPVYREAIDECLSSLAEPLGTTIRGLLLAGPSEAAAASTRLESPSLTLPALFPTEYAVAKLLESLGVTPAAMVGHSAGEYAAACLAGVLSARDAMALVALRGRLFESVPEGSMLSVALPEEQVRTLLGDSLSLAAVNAPSQCVVAGPSLSITQLEGSLRARDVGCTRVPFRVAAHSSVVEPILAEFEEFVRTIRLQPPRTPFVSNLTGTWITDAEATAPAYWARHLRETVRFSRGIQTLLEGPHRVFVEVGPGRTLSSFVRQQPDKTIAIATTLRRPRKDESDRAFLMGTLGTLWASGVVLGEEKLFGERAPRRVNLPTYPFERQRYWVDPDPTASAGEPGGDLRKKADIGDWFYAPSWARATPAAPAEGGRRPETWLVFSDESSLAKRLVEQLKRGPDRVVTVTPGKRFAARDATTYAIDPSNRPDYDALARELGRLGRAPDRVLHLWSLSPRRQALRLPLMAGSRALAEYPRRLALDYHSLVFLAQAFAPGAEALRVTVVSSQMQALPGDVDLRPEKAVLLGACRVVPREYPQVRCASIDVVLPRNRSGEDRLASQLAGELAALPVEGDVAIRGTDRWVRRFDRIRLPPGPGRRAWLRDDGVYVVTGGLGRIGLTLAEHLASHARARLVLVGRSPLPIDEDAWLASHGPADETSRKIARVRAIRAMGADVMTAAADVADFDAMRAAIGRVHSRFGPVDGVFHLAGQLEGETQALRDPRAQSPALDAKMKGALVLDALLRDDDPALFVMFSSVSSILGVAGQADESAAGAFLDAFALARSWRHPRGATLSIDWSAWRADDGDGMTPLEGLEALDRMLASPVSPQIVTSVVDLNLRGERPADGPGAPLRPRADDRADVSGPLPTHASPDAALVAPRDSIERELAAIWRELLGVDQIGIHDDFFELGGQSLIAVRVFQRIGKKYRVELPLATLFEAPTIADCAALLRPRLGLSEGDGAPAARASVVQRSAGNGAPAFNPLVSIRSGKEWPPFFCVHGAGGNVLNFRDVARAMSGAHPFYGLQAHGVDGATAPLETIEQMASAYLMKIRELQPEGPYLLGGYSGGGLVAFEMAHLLNAAGQDVKLLALIDTFHPQIPVRTLTMRGRVERLREEKLRYVLEALTRRRDLLREPAYLRSIDDHRARGEPVPFALRDLHLTRIFDRAAWRYRPRPWPGNVLLFRANDVAYIFRDAGANRGWDRDVLGGIEVVPVPGDHATIVLGRSAEVVARSLSSAIARARSSGPELRVAG